MHHPSPLLPLIGWVMLSISLALPTARRWEWTGWWPLAAIAIAMVIVAAVFSVIGLLFSLVMVRIDKRLGRWIK